MSWFGTGKYFAGVVFWPTFGYASALVLSAIFNPLGEEVIFLLNNDSEALELITRNFEEISELYDRVTELENNQNCIRGE
jgi:voltage-gated potassium channel Kch